MNVRFGVLRFLRALSKDPSERRRLAAAVHALLDHRSRSLNALDLFLRLLPTAGNAKLQLWQNLARCINDDYVQIASASDLSHLASAIRSTQAYADASITLCHDRNGFLQRGFDYCTLRELWRLKPPEKLFVFHHFDPRGLLPHCWIEALLVLQTSGWQVVLSSSQLDSSVCEVLAPAGVKIARRANIGICLGAYRDLALLLHSTPAVLRQMKALVFCNDSNLLVQPPEALVDQLERWTSGSGTELSDSQSKPKLSGLTDSFERQAYHLQSFLLHANRDLLRHPAWLRFWLNFAIDGSKDDLINQGEIGLSQSLLLAGVELKTAYPLVKGLITDPAMAEELKGYGIAKPENVNQSLFAWRSLLARGFPLVKKHVLFQLAEHQGQPLAIAELASLIPKERRVLLIRDIEQLLISRFSRCSARMS